MKPAQDPKRHSDHLARIVFWAAGISLLVCCVLILFSLCRILPLFAGMGLLTTQEKTAILQKWVLPCLICGALVVLQQIMDGSVRLCAVTLALVFCFSLLPLCGVAVLQIFPGYHTANAVSAVGISLTSHTAAFLLRELLAPRHKNPRTQKICAVTVAVIAVPYWIVLFVFAALVRPLFVWGVCILTVLPHALLWAALTVLLPPSTPRLIRCAVLSGGASLPLFLCLFPIGANGVTACIVSAAAVALGIALTVAAVVQKRKQINK